MFNTPILFLVFNRPDTTAVVFEKIKKLQPKKLFIAADGPRTSVTTDELNCELTKKIILDNINWDCEVKTLFNEKNLGCGPSVSRAISWFFDEVEEGIILEDDCVPNDSFFNFCEKMLDRYRHENKVMHIGGTNFQQGKKYGDTCFYFSAIPHVWGWATWKRAWKLYDYNLSDLNWFLNQKKIQKYFSDKRIVDFWTSVFVKMNQKKINTWDYQWQYAMWNNGAYSIIPQTNLISNIGFREDATHTTENSLFANVPTVELSELKFPEEIKQNHEADIFTFNLSHPKQ